MQAATQAGFAPPRNGRKNSTMRARMLHFRPFSSQREAFSLQVASLCSSSRRALQEPNFKCLRSLGPRSSALVSESSWDDHLGAWRIKNSWGKTWGEQGMAWVRYNRANIGCGATWLEGARAN